MKNDFPEDLRHGGERIARDLHKLVEDAQDLLRQSAQDAQDGAAEARAHLEQGVVAAQAQLRALRVRAARQAAAAGRYAGDHPLQVAGVAIALGALVALALLASRRG